jgi:hypothetical protein
VIEFTKVIFAALAVMVDPLNESSPRDIEKMLKPAQLQILYDVKLNTLLSNPAISVKVKQVAKTLQRICRMRYMARKVLADLEKRSYYHPAVLAMERQLQVHGLERYSQVRLDCDLAITCI